LTRGIWTVSDDGGFAPSIHVLTPNVRANHWPGSYDDEGWQTQHVHSLVLRNKAGASQMEEAEVKPPCALHYSSALPSSLPWNYRLQYN